jgi:hypothetical protein
LYCTQLWANLVSAPLSSVPNETPFKEVTMVADLMLVAGIVAGTYIGGIAFALGFFLYMTPSCMWEKRD